jgi:predicted DNA-binding transcriptional regulator YafY
VSHDTDKLIRQLSLVAFLMAERRPLTARDIKQTVEGYSEMSDEAFARRFYSDRAELLALGVPLHSERDEFTGEELYTLRSEQYFLPPLELSDEELAALQTCLYLLEGKFAYAEPLRLALQNLALGRPGFAEEPTEAAGRVEVRDPDYSPEMAGRLTKLESAISKQRTVRFSYWTISRDEVAERALDPYALHSDNGVWYVVGRDHARDDIRTFRVSRIRSDIRFATRRERDFRVPEDFDASVFRGRAPWQVGDVSAEAQIAVTPDTAWWVERAFAGQGEVADGVFITSYSDTGQLASWVLRQDGRARALAPRGLVDEVRRGLRRVVERHEGPASEPAPAREAGRDGASLERAAGPVAPERFAVLQALLAYLLARCGDEREADIPADEVYARFHLSREQLEEHLQLLNLVNFGGGCYAVYATVEDERVHVEKELFGDAFRRPPRLTPLEARAIRLALEFVGPMIAAEAHTPLERVRRKLEESFGQFELRETEEPTGASPEEALIGTFTTAIDQQRLVEIEYLAVGEETTVRVVEPYYLERELPWWYVHTWDRSRDDQRTFRIDRVKAAKLLDEHFEPRSGLRPRKLGDYRTARILFSEDVSRWRIERGATPLVDGTALEDLRFGSTDWLISEILAFRGHAEVLGPDEARAAVAQRARELAIELGKPPAQRAPALER